MVVVLVVVDVVFVPFVIVVTDIVGARIVVVGMVEIVSVVGRSFPSACFSPCRP